jgi:hypothetical protein
MTQLIVLLLAMAPAWGARVKPASLDASSSYPPEDGVKYDAKQVMDGKLATSWVEGDDGSGLGSWVELDLGGDKEVDRLKIWAGLWFSSDYWARANRPKDIELSFSDGSSQKFTLSDEMSVQEITIKPVTTSKVKLKVKSIHSGSTWSDTAISEIQVFDKATGGAVAVNGFKSSSKLDPDADGNYEPGNISDGIVDSMWCEANAEDGAGEWLELAFGASKSVSKMSLVNGIGGSLTYWMKGNRATAATLTFSDGSTESVVIKNSMMPQSVAFPAHTTSSVKVTFDTIAKGKEYNDLCISELNFQ